MTPAADAWLAETKCADWKTPQDIKEKVHAAMKYFSVEGYFRRIHPLLVIKPPFSILEPLRISRASAQLVDIPATVYELLDIDAPATDGESVFDLRESEPREIHLYAGVYTRDSTGRPLVLGQTMSENSLAHISYTPGRGWLTYPDLPASFD